MARRYSINTVGLLARTESRLMSMELDEADGIHIKVEPASLS